MAGRLFDRHGPRQPHYYRSLVMREFILKRPRRGWLGTGLGRAKDPGRPMDLPAIQVLILVAAGTFCFIACVPVMILLRLVFHP